MRQRMSSSQCLKIAQKCLTWQSDFTTSFWPYLQANRNEILPLLSLTIKSIFVNKLCSLRSQRRKMRLLWYFQTLWYVVANYCRIVEQKPQTMEFETKVSAKCQFVKCDIFLTIKKNESFRYRYYIAGFVLAPLCLLSISRTWPVTLSASSGFDVNSNSGI